jgi:vitamin-K-epoxide reductase (warfarin-sensitive)
MIIILILAITGIVISAYSYFIERKLLGNPHYRPWCNISARYACSKVMTSKYSNLLYIPNSLIGIAFYTGVAVAACFSLAQVVMYASLCACIISMILAYIMIKKVKAICVLCCALYAINVALLVASYTRYYGM